MFIPVVIDYSLLKDVAVVALSARGECRAEVCRLVDVGKLTTSWFLEVAVENTDHTVGLFSAVVREYPALFRNVRRFSTVVLALQADFALARDEKNSIIHPIDEGMVVATDASLGTGHRAGIAAVSTRGRVRARSLLVESVADAEFWAGKTPVLHILTDSQIVYKALNGVEKPAGCRNSLRMCASTAVFVHWVRGHRGNVLNELANDVAMYTRRNACWSGRELGEDAWTAAGYAT